MPRATGSGLMSKKRAAKQHLVQGTGGLSGEINELRNDLLSELSTAAAIMIEEFTNPATAAAAALLAATATSVAVQSYTEAQLLAGGKTALADVPRNVTFTTAGGVPADAPATATIVGFDGEGKAQSEVVNVGQSATTVAGVKGWSRITSITYSAGDGAGATVSIGFGVVIGLRRTPKSRAGAALPVREIVDGAFVTTGAMSSANKTYTPATAPDGAHDYAIYYEWDPTTALP